MMSTVLICFIVAASLLVVLAIYSAFIYKKALSLNPYNRKKEELLSIIRENNKIKAMLDEEIERLRKDKADAERIINDGKEMKEFIDEYQGLYDEKQKVIGDLEERIKDLAEKQLPELNEKYKELQEEKDDLERKNNAASVELEKYIKQIDSLEEEIDEKKRKRDELKKEIEELENKERELRSTISELEKKEKELEKIRRDIDNANGQYNDIIRKIAEGENDLARFAGIEDSQNKRWEDLDRPYIITTFHNDNAVKETSFLGEFKSNLKKYNISFSDRVLYAFHTGLKAQDASPLVVLAGISGTGKSLLPSLYAKAIGMNFLSVAVQPRWDSPQDMFGFYNYMQGRYKATELSRMLWQYDIYNNEEARGEYNSETKLPMNLVLLDEMNLARIEYYFSDMLSKLESRRGRDAKDDDARRISEIELECGSVSDPKAARRLYVNANTLFVGTMNEDETTQSLSDKVVDRSNVLRFGRPDKLEVKPNIEGFITAYDHDHYVSFGNWNNLKKGQELSMAHERRLNNIMENLNSLLENVGHPFAFRVWNSVKTYVSYYPGVAQGRDDAFNNAVADQIEMKILPKLNGIDKTSTETANTLRSISAQIRNLHDSELEAALERVIDDKENAFFQWKGVVRK